MLMFFAGTDKHYFVVAEWAIPSGSWFRVRLESGQAFAESLAKTDTLPYGGTCSSKAGAVGKFFIQSQDK